MTRAARASTIFVIAVLSGIVHYAAAGQLPVTGKPEPRLEAFDRLMLTFMKEHDVHGASLAIARNGKMVYARGFGYADLASHQPVEPDSLFRIASVSKPFTSAAILQLQERGKLKLDESAFRFIGLSPHLENGAKVDPRLWHITIRQLLHHTGGFDRDASFDPMFRPIQIAQAFGAMPPAMPREIVRYMMGRPLDFDPGSREAYSNFGYCVLGRVIEKASGMSYAAYVRSQILQPLGIYRMRVGRSLEEDRARGEVRYYPRGDAEAKSVFGDGRTVPVAYGGWCIEAMDSHGGWIGSAPELAQFASSLGDPERCPFLGAKSIHEMFHRARDTGYSADGTPKAAYYADGWEVRPVGNGRANFWHAGLLDGSASLLVHRYDGMTWAVLFNGDYDASHKYLGDLIDPLLHPVADAIKSWPPGWDFHEEPPRQ